MAAIDPLARSRLTPNLFILGNPKAGSTFLFACLRAGPFDPNLLRGRFDAARWRAGAYVVTALGPKKEFNFWGDAKSANWGWEWYVGPPAPLSSWEWTSDLPSDADGTWRRQRRGENGNGAPSPVVEKLCYLNGSLPQASVACRRFPIECFAGKPVVRPGCALVRPLPSQRGCGRPRQPACARPRVRMSHAWPLASEASPQALALDPSINMFMNAPDSPAALQLHHPSAATLKFIVLLREPLSRAQSSARMMREWHWDHSTNISTALLDDLARLRQCCAPLVPPDSSSPPELDGAKGFEAGSRSTWQRAASALAHLSDARLRRFRHCLARRNPLNHVRASVYAAGVLGWLSAGFAASQFLWLETEAMRSLPAAALLETIARFAGLPTEQLRALPADIQTACESRRVLSGQSSRAGGKGTTSLFGRRRRQQRRRLLEMDSRMAAHDHRSLPAAVAQPLQEALRPFNELLRTLLNDMAPTLRGVTWM